MNPSPDRLNGNVRLVLDLGRVEKVAEVALNGRLLGVPWKETPLLDSGLLGPVQIMSPTRVMIYRYST